MAAFYINRLSPTVRYTSQWGCPAIADLSNPQAGPDASAALQALANLGQSGPLEIVVDQPLLANQVGLYSGTTIRGLYQGSYLPSDASTPQTGLWMKKLPASGAGSANTCILKNANWASNFNASSPSSSSLSVSGAVDKDITIKDLFFDGQKRNGASNGTAVQVNINGEYVIPIRIHGIHNVRIENVYVYDPCCIHIAVTNVAHGRFKNLRFMALDYYSGSGIAGGSQQQDGLHFVGPVEDVEIDGLFGTTSDDFLALNFAEGNLNPTDVYPPTNLSGAGPHIWGGWGVVYFGNGLRVNARNLYPYQCADVMRIQVAQDPNHGVGGNFADMINVSNVSGSVVWGLLQSNSYGYNVAGGSVGRVTLRDWDIGLYASPPSTIGYQFGGEYDDVRIINHRFRDVPGASLIGHQVNLLPGTAIGRLEVDGYWIRDDSGESASVAPAVSVAQGSIDELIVRRSGWTRVAATSIPFAQIAGGTVNRVALSEVSGNNLANLLSITGGTVTQIDTTAICHRNPVASGAAGGAAVNVGTGIAVPNLTASGSDTAKLLGTSAGTITIKKTDGTERGA